MEDNPDNCPPNTRYGLLFWNNAAGYSAHIPRMAGGDLTDTQISLR